MRRTVAEHPLQMFATKPQLAEEALLLLLLSVNMIHCLMCAAQVHPQLSTSQQQQRQQQ